MEPINIPIQSNLSNAPTDLGVYISQIVGIALTLAAVAAFAYLIMGGLQWITAGGDKNKIEHARDRITNAIIGLAIVAVSWGIFLILDNFFGLGIAGATTSTNINNDSSHPSTQGVCIAATRCADGPVGSNFYCQNPNYTARTFGSCGTNMVYCDCVPR